MLIRTKRTDYESEAECRLVKCSEIWNHAQDNFDRPYVELSIPSTALRSITLGPCTPNFKQAEVKVRELLRTHLGVAESERIPIVPSSHASLLALNQPFRASPFPSATRRSCAPRRWGR